MKIKAYCHKAIEIEVDDKFSSLSLNDDEWAAQGRNWTDEQFMLSTELRPIVNKAILTAVPDADPVIVEESGETSYFVWVEDATNQNTMLEN